MFDMVGEGYVHLTLTPVPRLSAHLLRSTAAAAAPQSAPPAPPVAQASTTHTQPSLQECVLTDTSNTPPKNLILASGMSK